MVNQKDYNIALNARLLYPYNLINLSIKLLSYFMNQLIERFNLVGYQILRNIF